MRVPSGVAAAAALESSELELGQALALLRLSGIEEPERLPVGSGDRRLLELHAALTGRDVEVAVACPGCGVVNAAALSPESVPEEAPRMAPLGRGGGLREPTYADLLGLPSDREEAERELLRLCTVGAPERPPEPGELAAVDRSLTGPVLLECVECGAALEAAVDVEVLVLRSLQRLALELDREVHLLARTYGWSLGTIESLSDTRRRRLARLADER